MHDTTTPRGTLSPEQAEHDARQDERIRTLRRWLYIAVGVLGVGVVAADAISVHVALRRPPASQVAAHPSERALLVTVEPPPACPAAPACPACAACPACPAAPERHHR